MSKFEVKLVQIEIEEHPNADALELAVVGGFRAVVRKGRFKTGDYVAYVPEASVLPEWLLKQEGFWSDKHGKGTMAGSQGNRVKPVKLRGALSEGIVIQPAQIVVDNPSAVVFARFTTEYLEDAEAFVKKRMGEDSSLEDYDAECHTAHYEDVMMANTDTDLAEFFGIVKYEPPVPTHMSGDVEPKHGWSIKFDVENAKKYPDVLVDGERVAITEKLHGTFCQIGYIPETEEFIIASKGLGGRGLVFKLNEKNESNLYVKMATGGDYSLLDKIREIAIRAWKPTYVLGEIFGRGVQDLSYGTTEPTFRAFDMYIGQPQKGNYLNFEQLVGMCDQFNIPMVPVLYVGPYNYDTMQELTNGSETVSGGGANIREGVVVKPVVEREDSLIGRVLMKNVSEKYLMRKGKTTEFT